MSEATALPAACDAVFMGTPEFALPSLKILVDSPQVRLHGVFSQPDKPKGRGMKVQSPPVKEFAREAQLPVYQPKTLKESPVRELLKGMPELDFVFVVAYGKKIPDEVLNLPRYGCINLHPSLLPKYRGGAPMRRALFNGESETGVTTMYLDQGWDTGDIILQQRIPLPRDMDYGQLSGLLAEKGASLLLQTVREILAGTAPRKPQDDSQATHLPLLKAEEEWIDWSLPAEKIHHRIRGLAPTPGARSLFRNKPVKILKATPVEDSDTSGDPGAVVSATKSEGLIVATGSGQIELQRVQPAGKKPMDALDFINGYQIKAGEVFESKPEKS
jgi:methionyl-tRNA formyltransferase